MGESRMQISISIGGNFGANQQAGVHGKPPARNREDLIKRVISHMRKLQELPTRVASYFKYPKIDYAAA
jgi:hypothetical protein